MLQGPPDQKILTFNLATASLSFPFNFKSCHSVTKEGNSNNVENFRLIIILSPFSEIFEQIVLDRMYKHIYPQLHSFVKKKFTLPNLILLVHQAFT